MISSARENTYEIHDRDWRMRVESLTWLIRLDYKVSIIKFHLPYSLATIHSILGMWLSSWIDSSIGKSPALIRLVNFGCYYFPYVLRLFDSNFCCISVYPLGGLVYDSPKNHNQLKSIQVQSSSQPSKRSTRFG